MRVSSEPLIWIHELSYGGNPDSFNYIPMHTFSDIYPIIFDQFIAICSDLNNIPNNRKIGVFIPLSTSVIYSWGFMDEIYDLPTAHHLYRLKENYFISFHGSLPHAERMKLLDLETLRISEPDTNVLHSSETIYPCGDGGFYAMLGNEIVHYYSLSPALSEISSAVPNLPFRLFAYPNPFRNEQSIRLEGAAKSPICISVYDIRGRKVRDISMDGYSNPSNELSWDAKDNNGNRLLRASQNGESTTRKLMLLD